MDSDGEDEGMEFNLSVERLLDGERGGVRGVNRGGGGVRDDSPLFRRYGSDK